MSTYAPVHCIMRVTCNQGHPLAGLFVILRPAMPEVKNLETFQKAVGHLLERPKCSLGLVDRSGWLEMVCEASKPASVDPWQRFYDNSGPHTFKLAPGAPYDCYFVRHPDPALAYQAMRELDGAEKKGLAADWKPTRKTFAVKQMHSSGGVTVSELSLELAEDPALFVPQGGDRYGKWMLYRDMPNADCPPVQQAITRLQEDLGTLRYIVGDGERPYEPTSKGSGVFDVRAMNSVVALQKDALRGEAFKVTDRAAAHGKAAQAKPWAEDSWPYLQGGKAPCPKLEPGPGRRAPQADGVVDAATAKAVGQWNEQGFRKPGAILVSLEAREGKRHNWDVWMRPEAAEALYAWREITKALGFVQAVAANHTYRCALVDVGEAGFGRSAVSVHKTGLAIDLGIAKGYRTASADWPIRIARDEIVPNYDKKTKELVGHRIAWRLFAPSTLAAGETPEAVLANLRTKLEAAKNDRHPLGAMLRAKAAELLGELADPAKFYATYFRPQIQEWNYDPWHDEGGTPGELTTADVPMRKIKEEEIRKIEARLQELDALLASPEADPEKRVELEERRRELNDRIQSAKKDLAIMPMGYIDLTALGEIMGLQRIHSWTNKLRPTSKDWGLAAESVSTTSAKVLTDKIERLQPDHGSLEIDIDGKRVPLAAFDVSLMRQFLEAGTARKNCKKNGFCVSATLTKGNKKPAEELKDLLTEIGSKLFYNVDDKTVATGSYWSKQVETALNPAADAVPVTRTDGKSGSTAKSAKAWSLALVPIVAQIEVASPAEAAATPAPAEETAASESSQAEEKPRPIDDTEVVLLPGKSVYVPSEGAPIGMEWWHFQRTDIVRTGTFGDYLTALGWNPECLEGRSAKLYERAGVGYPSKDLSGKAG